MRVHGKKALKKPDKASAFFTIWQHRHVLYDEKTNRRYKTNAIRKTNPAMKTIIVIAIPID